MHLLEIVEVRDTLARAGLTYNATLVLWAYKIIKDLREL